MDQTHEQIAHLRAMQSTVEIEQSILPVQHPCFRARSQILLLKLRDHRRRRLVVLLRTDAVRLLCSKHLSAGVAALCHLRDYAAFNDHRQYQATFDTSTGGIGRVWLPMILKG
jgi:hypothetical protein